MEVESWNRRIHYYLGLYFLLFIWLFSFTGLLLNHPRWSISRIPNEPNPSDERTIESPVGNTDLERAHDVMRQLALKGEIDWPDPPQPGGRFAFNVVYPKRAVQVRVDLDRNRATVQQVDRSFWSALRISHTFSGSRFTSRSTRRDWWLTSVWVFAMDALAGGLVIMVFSSYYMWYRVKSRRAPGWLAITAGLLSCGAFVFGFALL